MNEEEEQDICQSLDTVGGEVKNEEMDVAGDLGKKVDSTTTQKIQVERRLRSMIT